VIVEPPDVLMTKMSLTPPPVRKSVPPAGVEHVVPRTAHQAYRRRCCQRARHCARPGPGRRIERVAAAAPHRSQSCSPPTPVKLLS